MINAQTENRISTDETSLQRESTTVVSEFDYFFYSFSEMKIKRGGWEQNSSHKLMKNTKPSVVLGTSSHQNWFKPVQMIYNNSSQ